LNAEKLKLSVVIVNYNVEYFLEQCLNAVVKAMEGIAGEIFVVDNNSIDHSVEMVKEKFPQVHLIANKENTGFSKANNQAMRIAKGEYILLLNPDTVVEEDTFAKCISFMDDHPEAGGLGVRMIDGKGNFLPESKRGLPTPSVAFYKIFGLSRIFPRSKRFGRYHLGYLDEFETNEIEILSGAYMFMRKTALDKVGLLDEAFFMYGEDIDLSYRIVKGGYKNYYFPGTQIIHYKGESTKKSSINYVFVFYRAMIIFAKKHFSNKHARTFSFLINLAIYFRAGLAILNRFLKKSALPVFDFAAVLLTLFGMAYLWGKETNPFPKEVLRIDLPIYAFLWCVNVYLAGGYDRPIKIFNLLKGIVTGTALILILYALLPKDLQFSRLFILLGTLGVIGYYVISRVLLHLTLKGKFDLGGIRKKTFAIIGTPEERKRVEKILKSSVHKIQSLHYISPEGITEENVSGSVNQLDQIVHIHKIDEVIFCARDNSAETIIRWMSKIASDELEFKIAQPDSLHLIGSNSIDTSGDLYFFQIDKISSPANKRNKRLFDLVAATLLLLTIPINIWWVNNKKQFTWNLLTVLFGKRTFVGYTSSTLAEQRKLPKINLGLLSPVADLSDPDDMQLRYKLNLLYAKDYTVWKDFNRVWQDWRKIGDIN
jgi:GT2 family glycosyltransferase